MTTSARPEPTTTTDDVSSPPRLRKNGAGAGRAKRPLVANRSGSGRTRTQVEAAAPVEVEAPASVATDDPGPGTSQEDAEAAIAARVARASRRPRRTTTRAEGTGGGSGRTGARGKAARAEPTDPAGTDHAGDSPSQPEVLIDAPRDDATTRPAARRVGAPHRVVALIAALVVAVLVASLAYALLHIRSLDAQKAQADAQSTLGSSAIAAATTYGGYLSSYNYKTLHTAGSAWAQVENNATASFRKDFTSTSGSLGNLLTQYNATATGKVIAAGLQSVSSSRAVVLLFVDQTVTNTVQKPNSVTQPLRVQLTMLRQGGKWLIDNLQVPS